MKTLTRSRAGPSRFLAFVTLALLLTGALVTPALAQGGDHGACSDGAWLKADWNGGWTWEEGPGWDGDAPLHPTLTVVDYEDGDPWRVDWTSSAPVDSVTTKAATEFTTFPGGTSGTVFGATSPHPSQEGQVLQHAISHIVFCYAPPPPPEPEVGSLTVTKTVEGDTAPADATYTFTAGDETFPLAHGGTSTLTGLEAGSQITVTETDTAGADRTTVNGVDGTSTTVTIEADQTTTVAFVNTYDDTPPPEPVVQQPAIELVKEAEVEVNEDGDKVVVYDADGEVVTIPYSYTITNTGNTTLTGITLLDDVLGPIAVPEVVLEPDEILVVTGVHTVTASDAEAGEILNVAVVTASSPDEVIVTDTDSELVLVSKVLDEIVTPRPDTPDPEIPDPEIPDPGTPDPETPEPEAPETGETEVREAEVGEAEVGEAEVGEAEVGEAEVRGVALEREPPVVAETTEVLGTELPRTGAPGDLLALLAATMLLLGAVLLRGARPMTSRPPR
jgi:hypothetical protein